MKLPCATANIDKFAIAQKVLSEFDIELEQIVVDIDEIQGSDLVRIVEDKAEKAFALLGRPVIVTDDGWSISALNGFPGAYMKEVNHWFTPEDFLRLLKDSEDRGVTLLQQVAYRDSHETVVFTSEVYGKITTEPRGNYGPPIMKIVELNGGNGLTISESHDKGTHTHDGRAVGAWRELGKWLQSRTQ